MWPPRTGLAEPLLDLLFSLCQHAEEDVAPSLLLLGRPGVGEVLGSHRTADLRCEAAGKATLVQVLQ